jgi:hypothetical protein
MGKFMLRLIGMYIPFVLVILGIGACSFVYQDELLGRFNQSEEVITEDAPELSESNELDGQSSTDDGLVTDQTAEESEIVDEGTEPSFDDGLPPIGECFCPDK